MGPHNTQAIIKIAWSRLPGNLGGQRGLWRSAHLTGHDPGSHAGYCTVRLKQGKSNEQYGCDFIVLKSFVFKY